MEEVRGLRGELYAWGSGEDASEDEEDPEDDSAKGSH